MDYEAGCYRGLLVNYGGVLATDLIASFRAFGDLEGLEPEAIAELERLLGVTMR